MVDKAETKLHYGRHGTCSGQNIPGKGTQQRDCGVRREYTRAQAVGEMYVTECESGSSYSISAGK